MKELDVDVTEGVGVLTLNRPGRRNALSAVMRMELEAAVERLAADDAVSAVVLTGAGTAFCAGGDLAALLKSTEENVSAEDRRRRIVEDAAPLLAVFAFPKPLIAAVNGPAMGAGLSLVLAADFAIAAPQAAFGLSFVRRGLMPDWGLSYLLPRVIQPSEALRLAVTGDILGAEEARRLGLVADVVTGDVVEQAKDAARRITANAPLAVVAAKAAFRRSHLDQLAEAVALDAVDLARLRATDDFREGVAAFLEKREPKWKGG